MNHADNIKLLHSVYIQVTAYEIPLLPAIERWLYEASVAGLEPEGFEMLLKSRKRAVDKGFRNQPCLLLRNLVRGDDVIADVLCEIAALKAKTRLKVYGPNKASVLKATGRPAEPEQGKPRHISEVMKAIGQ